MIKIYFCEKCKKDVLIMGMTYTKNMEAELARFQKQAKKINKILLINPAPNEQFKCPICNTILKNIEKNKK